MYGRVHTLMEKRKAEKQQQIRTLVDSLQFRFFVLFIISAISNWLLLFRFLLFRQGVNILMTSLGEIIRNREMHHWF